MGGDGGCIPGRADMVRTAGMRFKRNLGGMGYTPNTQVRAGSEKYDSKQDKHLRWTTCALTQEPLRPPLSACRMGQLYNRESILYRLLHKKTSPLPPRFSHIESRRDIRDLTIDFDPTTGHISCPIMKVYFDAGVKGIFFWSCGCIVSSKAFDALRSSQQSKCPICSKSFEQDDVVQLVPDQDKLVDLRVSITNRKEKDKEAKKASKASKTMQAGSTETSINDSGILSAALDESTTSNDANRSQQIAFNDILTNKRQTDSSCETLTTAKKIRLAREIHKEKAAKSEVYRSLFKK